MAHFFELLEIDNEAVNRVVLDSPLPPQVAAYDSLPEESERAVNLALDLCEKIKWAKDNDDKARIIAENAHEFVRNQLSLDNINLYVATLIHRIGELTVQGHNM